MQRRRIVVLSTVIGVVILGALPYACAMNCGHGDGTAMAAEMASTDAVNAGNTTCPVSGEKIVEKTKATYEYEGKIYNFCCAMCIDPFKKDPQKFIKKIV